MCGLLHDVGRFVMFEFLTDELDQIEETHWMNPIDLIEAEIEVCGFDHTELGWHACRGWKLPKMLMNLVHNHHNYKRENSPEVTPDLLAMISVVQMADSISFLSMKNPDFDSWTAEKVEQDFRRYCVPPSSTISIPSAEVLHKTIMAIKEEAATVLRGLGIRAS